MREDQAERLDDLRQRYEAGTILLEEFQERSAAILLEVEDAPVVSPPQDDNPPPSPIHVWNGDAWVLPAAHEISMLVEIEESDTDVDTQESVEQAQQRLAEQNAQVEAGELS
jgi:hypothetical protein